MGKMLELSGSGWKDGADLSQAVWQRPGRMGTFHYRIPGISADILRFGFVILSPLAKGASRKTKINSSTCYFTCRQSCHHPFAYPSDSRPIGCRGYLRCGCRPIYINRYLLSHPNDCRSHLVCKSHGQEDISTSQRRTGHMGKTRLSEAFLWWTAWWKA